MNESQDSAGGLTLFSTWDLGVDDSLGKDLLDLAKIKQTNDTGSIEEKNIVDLVDLSKFVVLEATPDFPGPCLIRLAATRPIQRLIIICDVPKAELYSGVSELCSYWKTVNGVRVEEFSELEPSQIFRYDVSCTIKVTHLEVKVWELIGVFFNENQFLSFDVFQLHTALDSIMVIGLHIYLKDHDPPAPAFDSQRVNFANVQAILNGSNVALSEGAQRALTFIQGAPSPINHNFLPTFPPVNLPPFEEMMRKFSIQEISDSSDIRLMEMEARLKKHFDDRLVELERRQNQKLDQILKMLGKTQ